MGFTNLNPSHSKRKFWHVHLSSLILLVLISGVLMAPNFLTKPMVWVDSLGTMNVLRHSTYGWPMSCCEIYEYFGIQARFHLEGGNGPGDDEEEMGGVIFPRSLPRPVKSHIIVTSSAGMAVDFGLAVLILAIAGILAEMFSRRRKYSARL